MFIFIIIIINSNLRKQSGMKSSSGHLEADDSALQQNPTAVPPISTEGSTETVLVYRTKI